MLEGLYEIVPQYPLRIFSETELELLISGLPDLDVDEWRAHADLVNYTNSDPIVSYFWRAVRSLLAGGVRQGASCACPHRRLLSTTTMGSLLAADKCK